MRKSDQSLIRPVPPEMKAPINPEADVNPPPPDGNPGDEIEDPGATDKPESMDRDSSEDSQTWEATQISLTPAAYRQQRTGRTRPLGAMRRR